MNIYTFVDSCGQEHSFEAQTFEEALAMWRHYNGWD